jgi:hypothetical protein
MGILGAWGVWGIDCPFFAILGNTAAEMPDDTLMILRVVCPLSFVLGLNEIGGESSMFIVHQ